MGASRRKFRIDTFLIVLILYSAAVLFFNFWTLFNNDFFASHYGWLIYVFTGHDNPTLELAYAKIVFMSLLCTAPILLIKVFSYIPIKGLKVFLYVLTGIGIVALIVYFYILTKDVYGSIPRSTRTIFTYTEEELNSGDGGVIFKGIIENMFGWILRFGDNIRNIYSWFLSPIIYVAVAVTITTLFTALEFNHWIKSVLFVFIIIPMFIGMPILIIFLGGIVSMAIEIVLFAIVGFIIFALFKHATDPVATYRASDGTIINDYGGGTYYDENGHRWHSDDGGRTAYKE